MNDAQLAEWLGISVSDVEKIEPQKRLTYERMADVDADITLWQAGLGPAPSGVIICGPKQIRGGRK